MTRPAGFPHAALRTREARRGVLVVIAMLVASLATSVQPASPTSAAAPAATVQVVLTIDQVHAIGCFDGVPIVSCGDADFYSAVTINGGPEQVSSKIDDDNTAQPDDWVFTSPAIDYVSGASIPITIEIYDSDGFFRGDDDQADVSPIDGTDGLVVEVILGNVPCVVNLPQGNPDGECGQAVVGWGFENDEGAEVTFRVNVLNTASDADGDGLADDWETNGVTFNGQFVDLPAMGADPNKPDIFIHLDWMADTTHNQRLDDQAIKQVVQAFANSGYVSPTGSVGINLWVDHGPGSTRDYATNTAWDTLSRAGAIPWQQNIGDGGGGFPYEWDEFQAIKDARFSPTGRSPIFHYAIAAFFQEAPNPGDPQNTSSGISRNSVGAGFADGGSDFLITLGNFGLNGKGTISQQAGTLMHELGHNLGLYHGGDEDTNFKPNYPSVMNYFWQFRGLDVTTSGVLSQGVYDYSHGTLPNVSEVALNEAAGLGAGFGIYGTATRCPIAGSDPPDFTSSYSIRGSLSFDWNCDGDDDDGTISWDANGSGALDGAHHDFDDWSALVFVGGAIGNVGDGDAGLPMESPGEPTVTSDNVPPATTASLGGTLGLNGWYTSAVTVTLTATDAGDGVAFTEYRVDGGAWTAYSAPFEVSGDSAGHLVEFRSSDNAGNLEQIQSVTIRIDTAGPSVTCGVTPARLWPPNHKLVPVAANVSVTDAGSGSAGFVLTSVASDQPDNGTGDGDTANDIAGFATGSPDVAGQLRAERAGGGRDVPRTYTLTYTGSDNAGNTATCATTVTVGP